MKFTVHHMMNKPIELVDREAYASEWRAETTRILEVKPKSDDNDAWRKINTELDVLQAELESKYPVKKEWIIESVEQLISLISTYGTISICKEDENNIIYIMDLPETQKIEVQN